MQTHISFTLMNFLKLCQEDNLYLGESKVLQYFGSTG